MSNRQQDQTAARLIESIAMGAATPLPKPGTQNTATVTQALVGQVNGEVIIMGDVPPNALEMILGRRRNSGQ